MKKEYIVLLLVIVGLGGYLFFRSSNRTHFELPHPAELPKDSISKIEITQSPDRTLILTRSSEGWQIQPDGYPVEKKKIDAVLETIGTLRVTDLISESNADARYQLDPDNQVAVKAWENGTLKRRFDIGKGAASFKHTFVRLADDPRIYLAEGNFRKTFEADMDDFRDKQVLKFDPAAVTSIHITPSEGEKIALVKKTEQNDTASENPENSKTMDTVWQSEKGQAADAQKVQKLLASISNLTCAAFYYDKSKSDFKNPLYTIQVGGPDNKYELSIYPKESEEAPNYPAVTSMNDDPFMLAGWEVEEIRIPKSELIPEK